METNILENKTIRSLAAIRPAKEAGETGESCTQCGKPLKSDLLSMFTKYQVCKQCIKVNHNKAIGKRG